MLAKLRFKLLDIVNNEGGKKMVYTAVDIKFTSGIVTEHKWSC